jgi:hypothetical protein
VLGRRRAEIHDRLRQAATWPERFAVLDRVLPGLLRPDPTGPTWPGSSARWPAARRAAGRRRSTARGSETSKPRRTAEMTAGTNGTDGTAREPMVWPTPRARDALALIRFLTDASGFEETLVVTGEGADGNTVHHAELSRPEGGGVMLGSVRGGGDDAWPLEPGASARTSSPTAPTSSSPGPWAPGRGC